MPRASIHTTTKLSPTMVEGLQSALRGEPSRHLTELTEHGGRSYTWRALVDRELLTEDNQITEAGRLAIGSNGGEASNNG